MIIVRLSGGIGNQLFQFGVGYSLAKRNKFPLLFDASSFTPTSDRQFLLNDLVTELPIIGNTLLATLIEPQNIVKRLAGNLLGLVRIPKVLEPHTGFCTEIAEIKHPCYLKGSFISYKYFLQYNDDLINKIIFPEIIRNESIKSLNAFNQSTIVCVNIRRGDFLNYSELNVCGKDYYDRCISWYRSNLTNPVFLFFSDDIEWVIANFISDDFVYWQEKNDDVLMTLYAMTQCDHHIIANSSFGWWGAWMNKKEDKIVLCPSKVVKDGSFPVNDFYLANWVKINP